jgi:2-polyprenyl-3-methyl-5-hydroxy-6-metoxy-1,4-benzoquinol methylase
VIDFSCVLCGMSPHRQIGILPSTAPGWWREQNLNQCDVCGLVSLHPLPTASEAAGMYTDAYYYNDAAVSLSARIHRAYWQFQDYLAQCTPRGRLLEIGCNNAFLLAIARQNGFQVQGVEISDTAPRLARELYEIPVFHGTVEEFAHDYSGQPFSTIYASAVLEHTLDPISFLQACRKLIAHDGKVILTMPNWDAWLRMLRHRSWGGYQAYHHYYFNRTTLAKCLRRSNFQIEASWNIHDDDVMALHRMLRPLKPIYRAFRPRRVHATANQVRSANELNQLMFEVSRAPRYSDLEKVQTILNWLPRKGMDLGLAGNAFGVRAYPI